jgi:hypothetical protein
LQGGGHASWPDKDRKDKFGDGRIKAQGGNGELDPDIPETFVRQETWKGGKVRWYNGVITDPGPLVNLGAKNIPINGQVFVQYSGLWGSPGFTYPTGGYWGRHTTRRTKETAKGMMVSR